MATTSRGRSSTLSAEGRALLDWFNAISKPEKSLKVEDLSNGQLIWTALQRIRPESFDGDLPEAEDVTRSTNNWLSNWQNLKYIYKHLASYITSEAGGIPRTLEGLDLQAVAKDEAMQDAIKLLKMVLFAAVNADDNAPFIEPMALLPEKQQIYVQQAIVEFQDFADTDDPAHELKGPVSGDKDLYWEEQLATMARENERLSLEKKDLLAALREHADRNTRLTSNNSSLQEKLSTMQEKLEQSSGSSLGGSVLKEIESKMKDQEDHIAYQETQLSELQKSNDELSRDAGKFRELQDKFQPLQDSFDELKVERDILLRKANTMDKYKAKLQTLADLEKENESLRSAMDELREVNRDGNSAKEQAKAFQRQIDEMSRMIPTIEQELFESKMMKQQLDDNARQLRKQLEDANNRYEQDQSTIRDLMDQLQSGPNDAQGKESLGIELDEEEKEAGRKRNETIHAVHAETNKKLEEALADSEVRYKSLESMLAAAKLRNKKLESQIESNYASRNDGEQFKGSPFRIPAETVLADLELRNQMRQELEKAELEQERGLFSSEDGDQVTLVDKHELQRMRAYQAQAEEAVALRTLKVDLETQVVELKKALGEQNASFGVSADTTKQQQEQISTKESEIKELKKQLESSKPALLKASEQLKLKQQIEILERENKLVASAFYDLSSRLQLNNVSLQRRSEAPRSFLNKQRLLVSQATAVRMPR